MTTQLVVHILQCTGTDSTTASLYYTGPKLSEETEENDDDDESPEGMYAVALHIV